MSARDDVRSVRREVLGFLVDQREGSVQHGTVLALDGGAGGIAAAIAYNTVLEELERRWRMDADEAP